MEKGIVQGMASILLKLIELRFEPPTSVVVDLVQQASLPQLEAWTQHFLSASSLESLLDHRV